MRAFVCVQVSGCECLHLYGYECFTASTSIHLPICYERLMDMDTLILHSMGIASDACVNISFKTNNTYTYTYTDTHTHSIWHWENTVLLNNEEEWNAICSIQDIDKCVDWSMIHPSFVILIRWMMLCIELLRNVCWTNGIVTFTLRVDNAWRENEIMRIFNETKTTKMKEKRANTYTLKFTWTMCLCHAIQSLMLLFRNIIFPTFRYENIS